MEIKVIKTYQENDSDSETFIYEGENIRHSVKLFGRKSEFIELYNKWTKNLNGNVIGVPYDIWNDPGPEFSGSFLMLYYHDKDAELVFLVVMRSKIYITNKGQTVDFVIV